MSGFEGFEDLDAVDQDISNMQNGLQSLGFRQDETTTMREADFEGFSEKIHQTNLSILNNWKQKKRTLVIVYYAGHGILRGQTKALCNSASRALKAYYPLERQLREMGSQPGAFVIGVFDCCRE